MADAEIAVNPQSIETRAIADSDEEDRKVAPVSSSGGGDGGGDGQREIGQCDTLRRRKKEGGDDDVELSAVVRAERSMRDLLDENSQPDNAFVLHETNESIIAKAAYSSRLAMYLGIALIFPFLLFLIPCKVVRIPQSVLKFVEHKAGPFGIAILIAWIVCLTPVITYLIVDTSLTRFEVYFSLINYVVCMVNLFFVTLKQYTEDIQKKLEHHHHHQRAAVLYKKTKKLEFPENRMFNAIGGEFLYSIGERRNSVSGDKFMFVSGMQRDPYLAGARSYNIEYGRSNIKWIFLAGSGMLFAAMAPLHRFFVSGEAPFGRTGTDLLIYVCFAAGAVMFFVVPVDRWIYNITASRDVIKVLERLSLLTDRENSRKVNATFWFGDLESAQSWERVRSELLRQLAPLFGMFEVNLLAIFAIIFTLLRICSVSHHVLEGGRSLHQDVWNSHDHSNNRNCGNCSGFCIDCNLDK
eukprot:TRINITY_DN419_c0_g1_i2.p1 TRINITY_DN419_c0_g1~~TRINITY_DN419_c0_g1_i2.p1  ORF type:complete len:467 (+),score=114.60 TRINITY_DN419_c0_g1_i2:72-1472(+)